MREYENTVASWPSRGREPGAFVVAAQTSVERAGAKEAFEQRQLADDDLADAAAAHTVVVDTRVRDVLRRLRSTTGAFLRPPDFNGRLAPSTPSAADEARHAVDVAVLAEADLIRVNREVDDLEHRLQALEAVAESDANHPNDVVRDEIDIVDAQISYHLNAGVDFVIVTDHDSHDGTSDVLESYVRDGHCCAYPQRKDARERLENAHGPSRGDGVRRRVGYQYRCRRVLDAAPRPAKEVLAAVPARYGVVWALTRHFVPRPQTDETFAERMTVRRLRDRPDQRSDEPVPAAREGRASCGSRDRHSLRCSPRVPPTRSAHGLVRGRRSPFPFPIARAVPPKRAASSTRRVAPRPVRKGIPRSRAGPCGERSARSSSMTDARTGTCGGRPRRGHEATRCPAHAKRVEEPGSAEGRDEVSNELSHSVEAAALNEADVVRRLEARRPRRARCACRASRSSAGLRMGFRACRARQRSRSTGPALKLVMVLVVRDDADMVDAQIAFHLNAGVDFVIATDHSLTDGTADILEPTRETASCDGSASKATRATTTGSEHGRLAVSEHGADWVIDSDADEFWMPRAESIKDILVAIPPRYGIVQSLVRVFLPRPDDGESFVTG